MIAAILLLAQAAAAPAPSAEQADARCLAAFGAMTSNDKDEVQKAGQLGALYFYGKLLGRDPNVDLKKALTDAAAAIGSNPRAELIRCGGELERSGRAMQAVGQALGATPPPIPPVPSPRKP